MSLRRAGTNSNSNSGSQEDEYTKYEIRNVNKKGLYYGASREKDYNYCGDSQRGSSVRNTIKLIVTSNLTNNKEQSDFFTSEDESHKAETKIPNYDCYYYGGSQD